MNDAQLKRVLSAIDELENESKSYVADEWEAGYNRGLERAVSNVKAALELPAHQTGDS